LTILYILIHIHTHIHTHIHANGFWLTHGWLRGLLRRTLEQQARAEGSVLYGICRGCSPLPLGLAFLRIRAKRDRLKSLVVDPVWLALRL
jgi:hypothetical protein